MQKVLTDFAAQRGLTLTPAQAQTLLAYGRCVWEKKDVLNLTSAQSFEEVVTRHLCDGLVAAAAVQALAPHAQQLADAGAGCGYIGMTLAAVLPHTHVTLIESLERRCKFMNWAALTARIANVTVKNVRLGQAAPFAFDALTERAMGPLPDIAPLCLAAVKPGGIFLAFQGKAPQTPACPGAACLTPLLYTLPCDKQPRFLVPFKKDYA